MQVPIEVAGIACSSLIAGMGVLWHQLRKKDERLDQVQSARVEEARQDTKILHEASQAMAKVTGDIQRHGAVQSDIAKIRDDIAKIAGGSV